MASYLRDFGKTAEGLSRNPLGIIALFIVLVYGIAALVLSFVSKLDAGAALPLIWFLVLFPVLVVILFYTLVTRHHTKLYAPHDFPDKEGFFRALTPTEQQQRLSHAVNLVVKESEQDHDSVAAPQPSRSKAELEALPTAVLVAEDLVFRELEAEFELPVRRHVAVTKDYQLDGFLTDGKDMNREIAIRFTRTGNWTRLVAASLPKMLEMHRLNWPLDKIQITFVVVADGLSHTAVQAERQAVQKLLESRYPKVDVDFRAYDFAELKRKYGVT